MKKRNRGIILAAAAVLLFSVGCSKQEQKPADSADGAEQGAPAEGTDQNKGDKLVMATNAEFPPYEYWENSEKIVGIDAEIAAAIAEELGMTLEISDMKFDSIIPAINSGKADFGMAGMTVTEDRQKNVDFSDTYIAASQVIIVKKDNADIKTPEDLTGKTIGVQLGTTGDLYASDVEGVTMQRYDKGFEAVMALEQGKVDAVVIDNEPAKVFESQNDKVMVIDEPFTTEEYAIAVKKGNTELLDKINTAIKNLKDSGKMQEILDKYISAE